MTATIRRLPRYYAKRARKGERGPWIWYVCDRTKPLVERMDDSVSWRGPRARQDAISFAREMNFHEESKR